MKLIQTITVSGTSTTSITFSSIPQDGTDLVLLVSARDSVNENLFLRVNTDAFIFTARRLVGNGSTVSSSSTGDVPSTQATASTSNTFSNGSYYFSNYTSGTTKTISVDTVSENNGTLAYQMIQAASYPDNDPITSVGFDGGTILAGSTFSLYKITKGSGGATVS